MATASSPPPELLREVSGRLLALMTPHFPITLSNEAPLARRIAAGLLARLVGTTESALHLGELGRQGDTAVVVRCLYEHVVVLAWLTGDAAASDQRIGLWQRADEKQRLRIDREVSPLWGKPVMSDVTRQRAQAAIDSDIPELPSLVDMAKQADADWAKVLGFDDPSQPLASLSSVYSILFRTASGMAHPTVFGLNLVMERTATHTVAHVEGRGIAGPTLGVVPALLGTALYVGAHVLGSPRVADVNEVYDWFADQLAAHRRLAESG